LMVHWPRRVQPHFEKDGAGSHALAHEDDRELDGPSYICVTSAYGRLPTAEFGDLVGAGVFGVPVDVLGDAGDVIAELLTEIPHEEFVVLGAAREHLSIGRQSNTSD
jgi:hypothetical protein